MQGANWLSLRVEPAAGHVVVRLAGDLDHRSQFLFEAWVEQLLFRGIRRLYSTARAPEFGTWTPCGVW